MDDSLPTSNEAEKGRLLKEVITHAQRMKVPTNPTRRKCVDGRYRESQTVGAMAIPGADLGISMALLNLGLSPQESFSLVYDFVVDNNKPYCWHTDTHEGHDNCVIGCEHCNAAILDGKHYGISSEKVSELLKIVKQAQKEKPNMEMITLNREHAEKGILVITSTDFTIKPWDEEQENQYFIYDKAQHLDFLKSLVGFAKSKGREVSYDDLVSASDRQTNATLGLLGSSKGRPIYAVDVSKDIPEVKYMENARVLE